MRVAIQTMMLILLGITTPLEAASSTYKFAVFPYLSVALLDEIYSPVSREMSRQLDTPVYFRTSSSFPRFFENLSKEKYDFALIQPFWYPPAVDRFHYHPLVRMQEPFTSLIVVLDHSPLQSLQDLKGKTIATPPSTVPVVHMAKRALIEAGFVLQRDVKLEAYKTVDSCFQQLLLKTADACISPPFAPAIIEEKMGIKLRVLYKSSAIPNLSLVAHSRVSVEDRERVRRAFLSWSTTSNGERLLAKMRTQGFIEARDEDYDVVRTFLKEIGKP